MTQKRCIKYRRSTEAQTATTYGDQGQKALQSRECLSWVFQSESRHQANNGVSFHTGRISCVKAQSYESTVYC